MNFREDIRIHLTVPETAQWQADIERIRPVLGEMPRKALILQAVHVLAWLIDQLDLGALAALVNGTTKETDRMSGPSETVPISTALLESHSSILQHLIEHIDALPDCDDCIACSDVQFLSAYAAQALRTFQAAMEKD